MPPPPIASRPGKQNVEVVRALYAYQAQHADELSFEEGDVLYVLAKENPDWWTCKCGERQGLVPSNYVGENTAQIDNPLHEAAKRGNISFVEELLNAGVSANGLDRAGNAPIHWACRGGHVEVVKMLISKQVILNVQNKLGDTPLHCAAWGDHEEVVRLLLSCEGIDVTIRNGDGLKSVDLAKGDKVAALLMQHQGSYQVQDMGADSDDD
ncbi:ankyrin repeat-containing domain protein [Globomyces pollinis-pini]|nr:ankyrin repeat-containing domain protein [Globomyces pollinis-pini]